jgi:hypothetical protein
MAYQDNLDTVLGIIIKHFFRQLSRKRVKVGKKRTVDN